MSVVSARRYGAVVAVNVLIGVLSVALPSFTHASPLAASTRSVPAGKQTVTTRRVVERTHIELVRNGGFGHGLRHWRSTGAGNRRSKLVHPGWKSGHAARVAVDKGHSALSEHLKMHPAVYGDRYRASVMLKRVAHRRTQAHLRLETISNGHVVDVRTRHIVLKHNGWRKVVLHEKNRMNGSRLVILVTGSSHHGKRPVEVDQAQVVQTVTIRTVRIVRTPGRGKHPSQPTPSTSPTPTPSVSADPTPTPTPTATDTPTPTPTPTPTVTVPPVVSPTPTPTQPSSSPSPTGSAGPCPVSALLVPSCGVWWGIYKPPSSGETWATTYTDLEGQVGRPFNVVYRYHDMSNSGGSGQFPDKYEQALGVNHILMFSWASRNFSAGTQLLWADIASGKYDASVINPEAARLKAYGKPVFLTFDPEMDRRMPAAGTAADYVAAYRHIHDQFAADGVTNVIWVWTVTGYGAHDSEFPSLYPGDAYVDWIGYDPYNFASCHNEAWKSFNDTIDPFYQWLESNGYGDKPFMLPEYGTVADPSDPSASGAWYAGMPSAMAAHPNIKAVMQWDDIGTCNSELTVNPGTLSGFTSAGHSPVFNQASGTS